jgi:hypothetical protein
MRMPATIEDLASQIWFGGIKTADDIRATGWEFRKGKGVPHINHAMQKARKNGMGATQYELSMLEVYLKDVLKVKRVKHDTTK